MMLELVPVLADSLETYYTLEELQELSTIFEVALEYEKPFLEQKPAYMTLARKMISEVEIGNNRRFLETVVPNLITRCSARIANTSWQQREHHEQMRPRVARLQELLIPGLPTEISVSESHPFTAKSRLRELLEEAQTAVTVVDAYIGIGTLDCLRSIRHPVRILTGQRDNSIEKEFDRALKEFRDEGHVVEIRRHTKLHDRYILFNDRCWLVGSSLKDAGKKILNVIECVDSKQVIVADIEQKWVGATEYVV